MDGAHLPRNIFILPNVLPPSVQLPTRTGGLLSRWLRAAALLDELSEAHLYPKSLLASEQTHVRPEADRAGEQIEDMGGTF